jgi:long-chain acyl-CoA synthetase
VARFEYLDSATPSVLAEAPPTSSAMLAYTSGTTGAPKAIVLTSSNIEANVKAMVDAHLVGSTDRVLLPLPLHHIYPFVVGLLAPLASGSTVVFPQSATGPDMLEAIRTADVSAIVGVPRLYSAMTAGLLARM